MTQKSDASLPPMPADSLPHQFPWMICHNKMSPLTFRSKMSLLTCCSEVIGQIQVSDGKFQGNFHTFVLFRQATSARAIHDN
ncbi:hypothetical protein V6N12_009964 [Hibiscus sabdariffa]|uniref:Uncharacterized protein n=1 Tax=Hibiscus sabdariffa TaxID=183260 RepID=A0ABR2EC91_9ROSI